MFINQIKETICQNLHSFNKNSPNFNKHLLKKVYGTNTHMFWLYISEYTSSVRFKSFEKKNKETKHQKFEEQTIGATNGYIYIGHKIQTEKYKQSAELPRRIGLNRASGKLIVWESWPW